VYFFWIYAHPSSHWYAYACPAVFRYDMTGLLTGHFCERYGRS
jgi:hypothetical protein